MKKNILLIVLSIFIVVFAFGCGNKDNPKASFEKYMDAWNKKDYKTMYSVLNTSSKKDISQKDFITKYTNIYNGIELNKLIISPNYPKSYKADSNGNNSKFFVFFISSLCPCRKRQPRKQSLLHPLCDAMIPA